MSGELINLAAYRAAKLVREQEEIQRELEAIDDVFAELLGSLPPSPQPDQHFMDDEAIFKDAGRLTHLIRSLLESDNEDDH